MRGKLGRSAPTYSKRAIAGAALMSAALARLGTPPSSSVARFTAVADWGVFGNDLYGDCVEADTAHDLLFRSTIEGAPATITNEDVLALYSALTGFKANDPSTDNGTSELLMSQYLVSQGFLGRKADVAVSLDPTNIDHIKWAVELFGSVRLGINFPASAGMQFDADQDWTVADNDGGVEGGHDVRVFNYRSASGGVWFDVVSWGKVVSMSEGFFQKYVEEAHAEIFADWCSNHGLSPGGFDLQTLISDARSLSA